MSAIFVLLVLAAMATVGVTLAQSATSNYDKALDSEKAYWAAREGLEWANYHAQAFQSCSNPDGTNPGGFSTKNTNVASSYTLGSIDAVFSVGCNSYDMTVGNNTVRVFKFVSTGTTGTVGYYPYPGVNTPASYDYAKSTRTLEMTLVITCSGACPASNT